MRFVGFIQREACSSVLPSSRASLTCWRWSSCWACSWCEQILCAPFVFSVRLFKLCHFFGADGHVVLFQLKSTNFLAARHPSSFRVRAAVTKTSSAVREPAQPTHCPLLHASPTCHFHARKVTDCRRQVHQPKVSALCKLEVARPVIK